MKISLLQCSPPLADPEAGIAQIAAAAERVAEAGAQLLVTPEMAVTGYAIGADAVARLAEPRDGVYHAAISRICTRTGIGICYGYPERGTDGGIYNAAQLVGPDGTSLLDYRKTHLFGDVDRAQFTAGDALSALTGFGGARVALAICYDVEFPELIRAYALAGADLVLAPTANMVPFDSVCTRIVPARSEENGIAIAYVNYVGQEGAFTYCGASCLTAPDGSDLARAGTRDPELITGTFRARRLPEGAHLDDRRPDLYTILAKAPDD